MRLSIALLLALAPQAFAQQTTQPAPSDPKAPLTLTQAMADPDWIGTPIEAAWWSWDGQRAYTQRKRKGATIRDTWVQPIAGGPGAALDGAALGDIEGLDLLRAGEGAVLRRGLHKIAAFRDDGGELHLHTAMCPHLGCVVHFNEAERSWDCPCHGSRFDALDGSRLNGPATHGLAAVDVPAPAPETARAPPSVRM